MTGLEGKVAIVTGAGAGLGRAIAERFAAEGAQVVIAEINPETGEAAAAHINARYGPDRAIFQRTDVTNAAQVAALIDATLSRCGRLDVLVNNAGFSPRKPFMEITQADWRYLLDLNLTSMFITAQCAAPHLTAARGNIINIASLHALFTVKGLSAYAAAKGGVVALTHSLALELAPAVRVNAIAPGLIITEGWRAATANTPGAVEQRLVHHPLGRLGQPEDIAGAAVFLASDDAAFITGVLLPVDGGLTIQLYRE